jgi:hypothetical protein
MTRADSLRDLQEQLETALLESPAPEEPMTAVDPFPAAKPDPLVRWFTPEGIAEWRAWRSGGPVPQSASGLELVHICVLWDDHV